MLRSIKDFLIYYTATGLGTGLAPVAPGTFGSILGVVLVYFFMPTAALFQLVVVVGVTALAIYASGWLAQAEDKHDPAKVVADEIAGIFVTFMWLPLGSWKLLLAGFVLFRILDIWKPWPIRKLENLPGGFGIVIDDVAAGVVANLVLHLWLVLT